MTTLQLQRTNSTHPDFVTLVRSLDEYLAVCDGEEHSFYHQFNQIVNLNYVVIAFADGIAVGCGAIKPFDNTSMEIKRMFVAPTHRGHGIAARIVGELEAWATELGHQRCVLETGKRQPEAIHLYTKCGYTIIPNYGQYQGMENSVCFARHLPAL
ncbi:MAG: GNAT family N-acetyltransferase [Bacteroidetes bacterium]|nr:GNAT family N-acetyltransferase [Bacteroidota bacterium]